MLTLLNPFKTYIIIGCLLASFGGGVYVTHWFHSTADEIEESERNKQLLRDVNRALEREGKLSEDLEKARKTTKTIVKEVEREVVKEVYRCPVPDDGRKLLNSAVEAANNATGQPSLPEAE